MSKRIQYLMQTTKFTNSTELDFWGQFSMAEKMILKISFLTGQSGHLNNKRTWLVNLFTAMLAAPSLMNESDKLEILWLFFSASQNAQY